MVHAFARPFGCAALLTAIVVWSAAAQDVADQPTFPTTVFVGDALSASVSVGEVTATVTVIEPADPESGYLPVLTVSVDDIKVAEATGSETDFNQPSSTASIANIDPDNDLPEVYFASYSGGAHCCTTVIVAAQVDDGWAIVPIGDFDGDGDYLVDIDGDGSAEIVTVDNRFLYQFDSYAASAAPLVIFTVRGGEVVDATAEPRYADAHRDWLMHLDETVEPANRWMSRGFLAGWLAEKIQLGEGAEAWEELNANWDFATDEGEEACLSGGDPEACETDQLSTLKFPELLRLFLTQNGYEF